MSNKPNKIPILIPYQEYMFWSKVDFNNNGGCWNWLGVKTRGYGHFGINFKMYLVHRISYQLLIRQLNLSLTIDHLCLNKACVNPKHLEEVSMGVNVLRGISSPAVNSRKILCSREHEFDKQVFHMVYGVPKKQRICSKCKRLSWRKRNEIKRPDLLKD